MTPLRVLFLLALALIAACDRAPVSGSRDMSGEWVTVSPPDNGTHIEQRMSYGEDGSYTFDVIWYGYFGHPSDQVTGAARSTGRYRLDGDRLEVRIVSYEEWYRNATSPSVTLVEDPKWEAHGTVRVEGDRLLHTFVSAPLDVPVESTVTYQRAR